MKNILVASCVCIALVFGALIGLPHVTAAAAPNPPSQGYTLHIDALGHFPAHPSEVAHHWCKGGLAGGLIECQLYDSDAPNAHLIGVETIVSASTFRSFSSGERTMWHYHKTEIPAVHATLPGMSPAQQKKVVASIINTYGKIYVLFDPMTTRSTPTGKPSVTTPSEMPH